MSSSDENIVIIGAERFLLRESVVPATRGVHVTSFQHIKKCDVDPCKNLDACRALRWHDHFPKDVERMTSVLTALATSTMRSRWLLRFGLNWSLSLAYVLLGGNIITVGAVRFHYVEVLLQPNFIGKGASGIHDTSFSSNMKIDVYIRKELYGNVMLSSGTTMV